MKVPTRSNPDKKAEKRPGVVESRSLPREFEMWFFQLLIESKPQNRYELSAEGASWVNTFIADLRRDRSRLPKINQELNRFGYQLEVQVVDQKRILVLFEIADSIAYFYQNVMRRDLCDLMQASSILLQPDGHWWVEPLIAAFQKDKKLAKRCQQYFPEWSFSLCLQGQRTMILMQKINNR